jgi:hypothetical protein
MPMVTIVYFVHIKVTKRTANLNNGFTDCGDQKQNPQAPPEKRTEEPVIFASKTE